MEWWNNNISYHALSRQKMATKPMALWASAAGVYLSAGRLPIPAFFQYPITPPNCERSELSSNFSTDAEDYCREKGIACSEDERWLETGELKTPVV